MTEAEWLTCARPSELLRAAGASARKRVLLACAFCRTVWDRLADSRSRAAVEVLERFADGTAPEVDVSNARHGCVAAYQALAYAASPGHSNYSAEAACHAALAVNYAVQSMFSGLPAHTPALVSVAVSNVARYLEAERLETGGADSNDPNGPGPKAARERAYYATAALVRDIFGNPFRPVAFDPAWRTDTAVTLARQMYQTRNFGAMPILADALQDAGCDNEDVLNHCRDADQVHVRGCWVVDGVLGL